MICHQGICVCGGVGVSGVCHLKGMVSSVLVKCSTGLESMGQDLMSRPGQEDTIHGWIIHPLLSLKQHPRAFQSSGRVSKQTS